MHGNPRTALFKKKVALEALKGDRTVNEIALEYGVHPVQVSQWKKDGIEPEKADLEREIGRLTT